MRNLVICCDGTANQFGTVNTNVVRLIQSLDRKPNFQRIYYDPGIGTLPEPGWLPWIGEKFSKVWELAFGRGIIKNVRQAYSYLMDFWEPDMEVFLFGFSRGAYTVRILAAMLHQIGLLPRGASNLLPYAIRLFKSISHGATQGKEDYWKLCNQFRWTFSREVKGNDQRHFPVHFMGLWDTVASVGWIYDPPRFPFANGNPSIEHIRHAIAIDERRWFFRDNQMEGKEGQTLEQQWFPGVHADVGGGYPESDCGLWRPAFEWILNEASQAGLGIDSARLQHVLNRHPPPSAPWNEPKHESLAGAWWLAEIVPKTQWQSDIKGNKLSVGLGRHRTIDSGYMIHESALKRIQAGYSPPNLSDAFKAHVKTLQQLPQALAAF